MGEKNVPRSAFRVPRFSLLMPVTNYFAESICHDSWSEAIKILNPKHFAHNAELGTLNIEYETWNENNLCFD